jgi:Domain of unknown function (DUF397)
MTTKWKKSSKSGPNGGMCVEVARLDEATIGVRDSKDPDSLVLTFTPGDWDAFLDGAKRGKFDL